MKRIPAWWKTNSLVQDHFLVLIMSLNIDKASYSNIRKVYQSQYPGSPDACTH